MVALMRWNVRNVIVLVLLGGLAVALTGFSGSPQGSTGTFTAPTDVAAAFSDGSITVSWTPGSGAASQVTVVVNVLDDTDYCLGFDATGSGSSYECEGVTAGATYVVLVIALDGEGGYALGKDSSGEPGDAHGAGDDGGCGGVGGGGGRCWWSFTTPRVVPTGPTTRAG